MDKKPHILHYTVTVELSLQCESHLHAQQAAHGMNIWFDTHPHRTEPVLGKNVCSEAFILEGGELPIMPKDEVNP